MNPSHQGKAFIVVGGRSPIAISCSKFLAEFGPVIHVTRSAGPELRELFKNTQVQLIEQDLSEPFAGEIAARKALALQPAIAGIAFLQRYRAEGQEDSNFVEHMKVEVWSSIEMLRTLSSERRGGEQLTALIASSPAAEKVVPDQSLDYHIVKSAQESSFRYLSRELAANGVECISVRIGSLVIKDRAFRYWNERKHMQQILGEMGVAQGIPSADKIGHQIANIISNGPLGISGQTVVLDGGLGLVDGPQAAKSSLELLQVRGDGIGH